MSVQKRGPAPSTVRRWTSEAVSCAFVSAGDVGGVVVVAADRHVDLVRRESRLLVVRLPRGVVVPVS